MKKRRQICGRKTSTPPIPATMPSATSSDRMPGGRNPRTASAAEPKNRSIRSIGTPATRKMAENSAAIVRRGPSAWDAVRPGIFLYGVGSGPGAALQPEPVAGLHARVLARLCQIAEAVETQLGLEPLADPDLDPSETEESAED